MVKKLLLTLCFMSACLLASAQQSLNLYTTSKGSVTFTFDEKPVVTFNADTLIVNTDNISVQFPFDDVEKITFEDGVTAIESIRVKEGNGLVSIYNMSGVLVRKYKPENATTTVDLSALPAGIYVVNDGKRTYKVMKR